MIHEKGMRVPPSRSEQEALATAFTVLTSGARSVGLTFTEPDDDWMPIWMVVEPNGTATMITGDVHKHEMARRVAAMAKEKGAIAVGFISSVWTLDSERVGSPEQLQEVLDRIQRVGGSLEFVPGRLEQVMIATYSASTVQLHSALISRYEDKPPKLGPFQPYLDGDLDGVMVRPIQAALIHQG